MKIIPKQANIPNAYKRNFIKFNNGRDAWHEVIGAYLKQRPNTTIILPSYIGFSINEGSGIFDPVTQNNATYQFYSLDENLSICFNNLKDVVNNAENPLVLLVHYFGFPDSNYLEIANWLIENDILFIEDAAHAMLTDLIGGICGRKSSYTIYSLHKILPYTKGGILVNNSTNILQICNSTNDALNFFEYDLKTIFDRRRTNYSVLLELLNDIEEIKIIHPFLKEGICPQTFPIIIKGNNRDNIYFEMNKNGFGLVSLYHTMIDELVSSDFAAVAYTSKHIINLPIHQDCDSIALNKMVDNLKLILLN